VDLGLVGRRAVICGASRGLGLACASALAVEGVSVVINGRSAEALESAANSIKSARADANVTIAPGDVTTREGRDALLAACPTPDILITNAGGPPVGDWRSFEADAWHSAVDSNMVSAIELIRAVTGSMADRGLGRVVNITSAVVKMPHEMLALSVAARLGLTGFVRAIAPSLMRSGVTINNLLPEQFETDRFRSNISALAKRNGVSPEEELARQRASIPAGRFGAPHEFGSVCAFLCSAAAGYMTGQNITLDGGRYPGVF